MTSPTPPSGSAAPPPAPSLRPASTASYAPIVQTLERLGDAVVIATALGVIEYWGVHSSALLGHAPPDVVGRSLFETIDPAPLATEGPGPAGIGLSGWSGPAAVTHQDRRRIAVHLSATPLPDDGVGYVLVRLRRRPERATPTATQVEAFVIEQALEQVSDVVMITAGDPAGDSAARIVYVNAAFERVTGYRREEVVGRSPAFLRGPDTDAAASARLDDAARDRRRIREEVLNYSRTGEPIWLDIDVMPVETPGARYVQWVAIERDRTPQRGAEAALRAREERLRLAMNAVWDGVWDWHVPTGYCYFAPRWAAMLGFMEHALAPHIDTFLDLLHPQDLPRVEQALREHFDRRRSTYALEVRLRTSDNQWRWILTRGTVVERDQHDRPVRMIGTHADISERKRAELALRESEERFRLLSVASPLGIWLADAAGAVTYITPRLSDFFGRPAEALLGDRFLDQLEPEHQPAVRAAWARSIATGDEISGEVRILRPDGSARWLRVRGAPRRAADETIAGYVGTVEDITAARTAERAQQRLQHQMQQTQKLESLGVLAGGIAHDFNNLLVGILGNVSMARSELAPGAPVEELLADVEVAARRAADLTNQLLAYAGKGRFEEQTVDLSVVVREMTTLLQSAISKGARLEQALPAGVAFVRGDVTQLRQVVMNLITNASEALEQGEGRIHLRTGVVDATAADLGQLTFAEDVVPGRFAWIEVEDSGIGMAAETAARIFDPFFTTKFTGRGLGLAATLGIVRRHGGAVHVQSAPGAGATFRVLLPLATEEAAQVHPATPVVPPAAPRGAGVVLVVDDEEAVRTVARRILERQGYTVLTAVDGEDALRAWSAHRDRIVGIVLDLTMPRLDGAGVLARLRAEGATVPVVLASGYSDEGTARPGAGDPGTVFVQKPYVAGELVAALTSATDGARVSA